MAVCPSMACQNRLIKHLATNAGVFSYVVNNTGNLFIQEQSDADFDCEYMMQCVMVIQIQPN